MEKIYLISFYFRPYKGVGALRLSYWYDRLKGDGYDVTVFTATPCENEEDLSIIRLPIRSKSFLKDSSFIWGIDCRKMLTRYLDDNKGSIIIISGGPFLHMLPILALKKAYSNCRWIIDYRDPLSSNPRNKSKTFIGKVRYLIKYIYEKIINSFADQIITVNEVCRSMVMSDNVYVIDNGFDERCFSKSFPKIASDSIIYAGKTKYFSSLKPFFDAIHELPPSYTFDYVGPDELTIKSDRITSHGFCNYKKTVELLNKSSIGLILTNGKSFESTTKVFDYFAAKLKILIITHGVPKTGTLYEITKNNPNVEWSNDTSEGIKSAILKLERPYKSWDYDIYSRSYGYSKLKMLINNLL